MFRPPTVAVLGFLAALICAGPALAQIRPLSSGEPSFREPEMRHHGDGFSRPNRPRVRGRNHVHRLYRRGRPRL